MVSFAHLARESRQQNSGGRYPHALSHATTLAIMLSKLAREDPRDRPAMTIVALFLWLTQAWPDIRAPSDIPDFVRISGAMRCRENTFRTYRDGSRSWAEYAHRYDDRQQEYYLWQPIPSYLNEYFQPFISTQSYETPFLRRKAKVRLFHVMNKKWKTPLALSHLPRVRKDAFHQYLIDCALVDNTLTAIPRSQIVARDRYHHKYAGHYQRADSDRIRYKLFDAHHRYLSRLIRAARNANLSACYQVFYDSNHTTNLIAGDPKLAHYLTSQTGRISQYVLDTSNGSIQLIRSPSLKLGSQRVLDETAVAHFFNQLFTHIEEVKPRKAANRNQWRHYYCLRTNQIALLFILLSGTRPTHSISILNQYYWGDDIVFVKDKGRLRQVIICDYLQREIQRYQQLQSAILSMFSSSNTLDELWFYLDDQGHPYPLTARSLRLFMNEHWPGVVPYQLRHFFAQSAVSDVSSARLLDNNIDRLMGHEALGEHLGSDSVFAHTVEAMKTYLNQYSQRLGLKEMPDV
ncbi:hypothetical protein KW531_00585 [Vibrio fluvialis]|nr:hypothetical protein [Vibrio fluvialis]